MNVAWHLPGSPGTCGAVPCRVPLGRTNRLSLQLPLPGSFRYSQQRTGRWRELESDTSERENQSDRGTDTETRRMKERIIAIDEKTLRQGEAKERKWREIG